MKRIRKSRTARVLSWLLTAVMVMPLLQSVVAPRPAFAQGVALGNEQSAIIVDFENKSGVQGELLSRFVTTAVANELEGTGKFIFLSAKDVDREAADQGRKAPYDTLGMSAIASKLGAATVVSGEITKVWIDSKHGQKTVRVGVKIRMGEPASGDVLNGAAQIGEATARPGQDDDALVQEAARNAVTLGVKQIMTFTLPEGIILNVIGSGPTSSTDVALVNKGHTDGLRNGTQMIVFRGRVRTGKILITNAMARDSEAKVLENTYGIRPEDRVRAIFPMPDFPKAGVIPGATGRKGPSVASAGTILAAFLVGVVIWSVVQGANKATLTAVSAEAETLNGTPAVRLQWRDTLFAGQVREYQIWRNPDVGFFPTFGTPVAVTASRQYDDKVGSTFWGTGAQFLRATKGAGNDITDGAEATATDPSDPAPSGPTAGNSYTYPVGTILRRIQPSGTIEDVFSDAVTTGQVTPINPVGLLTPVDQSETVSLTKFDPTWQSKRGATVFVIEVSPDNSFQNKAAIAQLPMVLSTAPSSDNVTQRFDTVYDLTKNETLLKNAAFKQFVTNGVGQPSLYWRVGARNNDDVPGPVHWFTKSRTDTDRTFRFIYSQVYTFKPAPQPPPQP